MQKKHPSSRGMKLPARQLLLHSLITLLKSFKNPQIYNCEIIAQVPAFLSGLISIISLYFVIFSR